MTPARRSAIYSAAAAILTVLGVYGIVTAAQADQWLRLADSILTLAAAAAPLVARRHITPDKKDE